MRLLFKAMCAAPFLMALVAMDASAQAWPSRPINFYISIGPGSFFESTLRVVAAEASKVLGQPVIIENKVGAGGKIGLQAIMNSAPDGYTIGQTFNGVVVTRVLLDKDFALLPGKDYAPITMLFSSPLAIIANSSAPFRDFAGMMAYVKANPGKLNVSGASPSSNSHLSWELLKTLTGADINVVTHRAEAAAVVDLLNGSITAMVGSTSLKSMVESGKLIGVAVTSPQRWDAFPNLPTLDEAGVKGFDVQSLNGIVAPAGTPPAIIARLNEVFRKALSPEIRKRMSDGGLIPVTSTPEEYGSLMRSELDRWRPVMQKANLKLE